MKMKDSLVKKHHFIYDWLTFVLTREVQIWKISAKIAIHVAISCHVMRWVRALLKKAFMQGFNSLKLPVTPNFLSIVHFLYRSSTFYEKLTKICVVEVWIFFHFLPHVGLRVRDWVRLRILNSLSRAFGCDLSCEYHSLSILLCWSATGRNDGFENVTVLKWESCTRTQSRTRSQIWRSLLVWLSLLLGDSHCIGRNKEKLFECTCKTDEWQILMAHVY